MTTQRGRRWSGLVLGLAGVLLTGCSLASARGATINTFSRPTTGAGDCPPAAVAGTAPGLDAAQEANAKTVVGVALGRGFGPTGAAIAVAAAPQPSPACANYANDGTSTLVRSAEVGGSSTTPNEPSRAACPHGKVGNNLDSIGLFQQRLMTGWGTPDQLINPATATGKFLDRMVTIANWQTVSPWTVAPKVQGSPSSDGGIYRDSYQQATAIVATLNVGSTATTTGGAVVAQAAAAGTSCEQPAANAATGPAAWGGYQNGHIPATALCSIPSKPALQLECGAATAFDQLNTAFKAEFGQNIGITDGYRSYDEQVQCRLEKGSLCANPGTSNHGWGKAVDIGGCCGINSGTGPAFDWLTATAGRYGWNHPAWAQPGGSKPEPWHWEYGAIS